MKNIPGLLLLILIAFQPGCRKGGEGIAETNAHVRFGGDPSVDGIGYFMQLDSSSEVVVAVNLPSSYKHEDVNEAVAVRLIDTGKRYRLGDTNINLPGLRGVYIVTLRKL
jgi:hypothetical protein